MTARKKTLFTDIILVLAFCAVFAVSFFPQSSVPIYGGKTVGAIYNGNREKNCVSLMFNVYENTETVNAIIDLLNERGVKATFFVGGCWADDNAATLIKIAESGHETGNHGYFHKDHAVLDYDKNREEILLTGKITQALSGVTPVLFAPPSGSFSDDTLEAAFDLGYKVIMWSKDTIDWRDKDVKKVFDRATNGVTNGDLILMHPKAHTLAALPDILDYYERAGLKAVTVSENIA